MSSHYLIKEEGVCNDIFAIILKRTKKEETLEAIRVAINEEFCCYCKLGIVDLEEVKHGSSQILHVEIHNAGHRTGVNIAVSTTHLY